MPKQARSEYIHAALASVGMASAGIANATDLNANTKEASGLAIKREHGLKGWNKNRN